MTSKVAIIANDNLTLEHHKNIILNSDYTQYQALSQQIYNLSRGIQIAGAPLPNISPKSKYTLIPGILYDEQNLGEGQPNVMRLIDFNNKTLHDLKLTDIQSKINFYIDENDKILISCKEGSKIDGIDISGMGIASILFNIFNNNGILDVQSEISLNLINNNLNNLSLFSISGEISGKISETKEFIATQDEDIDNNIELLIKDSNLLIKTNENTNSLKYLKNIKFKIDYNSELLSDSNIFIHITPSSAYNVSYDPQCQEFEINLDNLLINNEGATFIEYKSEYFIIGTILPYAYHIQKEDNLGEASISYYNINNLSFNKNNLFILSSNNKILGEII